ncbi:MAG: DUF87 domain-containing protein [Candidatus Caldarchaeum sp.]
MSIMFLIGLGYYGFIAAQQAYFRVKGVNTTPVLDIKSLTNQITYWLSVGFAAVFLTLTAILLGRAVIKNRRLLGVVPFRDFQKHLLIVGPTGSGKTNTAKQAILMAVRKGVKVVVLDWKAGGGRLTGLRTNGLFRGRHHLMGGRCRLGAPSHSSARRGEYTTFIEGATIIRKLNPWDVGGRSAKEKAAIAVELLREITRDIADVSSASAALLLRELVKLYQRGVPKTSEVVDALETFFKTAMAERRLAEANMAAALTRRLLWLQIDEERKTYNTVGSPTITVYDMSQLGSVYLKTIYSLVVLTKVYYEAVSEGQTLSLRRLVVAEECQNYVRPRRVDEPPSIGERIINELRSYGVGVLLVAPDPAQIPWHLPMDVGATVAISLQAIPNTFKDIFRAYEILKGRKTYVFHNGKLHTVKTPKRPPKTIRLEYLPPPTETFTMTAEQPSTEKQVGKPEVVSIAEEPSPAPMGNADLRWRNSHT